MSGVILAGHQMMSPIHHILMVNLLHSEEQQSRHMTFPLVSGRPRT